MNEPAHGKLPAPATPPAVGYREYKILLRADHFDRPTQFHKFWKVSRRTAKTLGIAINKRGKPMETRLREVLFFDTPRFRLYNHGFILRRRTFYREGLPESAHELTVKYRTADHAAAANVRMAPLIPVPHIVKFKEEALMDHAKIGSIRFIYSHSSELTTTETTLTRTFGDLTQSFPALLQTGAKPGTAFGVTNGVAIEEVLVNMGEIDFGGKVTAKATLAIWRHRNTQEHLVGEYSYQIKFPEPGGLHGKPKELSELFFVQLQIAAAEWLHIGTTKTAMVYSLGRTPVSNHE